MSSFRVDIDDSPRVNVRESQMFAASNPAPSRYRKTLLIVAGSIIGVLLVTFAVGYLYWRSFYTTPQYSLALIIDAAKRDDKEAIDALIDTNAVVDDFVPQIAAKAVELYGRGVPKSIIEKLARVALPVLPAVKDRARAELPRVIRERSERFGNVPFAAMVVGASRYLDIVVTGDSAVVKSKLEDRPFEVKMRRNGDVWQIVGVRDEELATNIAQKVGQEMIAIAGGGLNKDTGNKLGVGNLSDLLRQAEELVK